MYKSLETIMYCSLLEHDPSKILLMNAHSNASHVQKMGSNIFLHLKKYAYLYLYNIYYIHLSRFG